MPTFYCSATSVSILCNEIIITGYICTTILMTKTIQYLLTLLLIFSFSFARGQKDPTLKPAQSRELFHDFVDKEQQKALKSDGKDDKEFTVSPNEDINVHITTALIGKVNQLQKKIEQDSLLNGQVKVRYIRGLERLLQDMNTNWKSKRFVVTGLPTILNAYERAIDQDSKKISIENIIEELNLDAATPLVNCTAFDNNPGYKISKNILVRKYCELFPDQVFTKLQTVVVQIPDLPFMDSLIKAASYRYPKQLYDYAAANNPLSRVIRKINDPMVQTVSKMANGSGSGQLYFPFLDNIVRGKMTIAEIDAVRNDSVLYYKLLVKTHLDYTERLINKDTAFEYNTLTEMMGKKAKDVFVNTINGLHDQDDVIRFRIIQSLNAAELYYLAVMSDGIIYTSSFVKGVFPLMLSRAGGRGDSVLKLVLFDKYRKFIKMSAGYNTLSAFLASFPNQENAGDLMRAFVGNLEKSSSLEDGVDVADSYASIAETIKPLADEMLNNVKLNYDRNLVKNDKRGMVIYNLLQKLFLSADTTKNIDLTKELGIPPVYSVNYASLANDTGMVAMQVFFYGDQDGQNIFGGFQKMFAPASWKITPSKQWITISSLKGKPITIYANRPLPEETGEDERAQKALDSFLVKKKIQPTVVIHRGHSYYATYTIDQIKPKAKIVFMGSCGGYHLIHDILKHAPDAHIIASKQIGKTAINRPFFELLMEKLRNGSNIEWISFWKEFQQRVKVEGFEDYIPPHKNLGALFIKAYKISMGETEPDIVVTTGAQQPATGNR